MSKKDVAITFGIINCNRLHYLRSCLESLQHSLKDTSISHEIIIIDNSSVEEGTESYLNSLDYGPNSNLRTYFFRQRDPANEFARGLNKVVELANGELICPLQGDTQFIVVGDWLQHYVNLFKMYDNIGCIAIDAQRRETIRREAGNLRVLESDPIFPFAVNTSRPPVAGAGDVFYRKSLLHSIGEWSTDNQQHEGGHDSETDFLRRVASKQAAGDLPTDLMHVQPIFPVSACIYTDPRGTNARVRGNRRYGQYWPPVESFTYYKMIPMWSSVRPHVGIPNSIEQVAIPVGWKAPLDKSGMWMKNPIRPETAGPDDYVELIKIDETVNEPTEDDAVSKWLFGE